MPDDEDVWPCQLRQVGGLRLVGAWPCGVRLVGIGLDGLPSPRRCLARNGLLHRKKTWQWSVAPSFRCSDDVGEECWRRSRSRLECCRAIAWLDNDGNELGDVDPVVSKMYMISENLDM